MTSSMLRPERRADEICTWRERYIRPAILFLARALCERPCVYMWVVTWFRQVKDKDGETVAFFQELSAQAAAAERGEEGDEKAEEDTTFSDPADGANLQENVVKIFLTREARGGGKSPSSGGCRP